ncbi:MAG: DUF6036 family nucleotidyltransferase [Chthoniobacterales bacterium]
MPKDLVWPPVINRDTPAWRTLETLLVESPPSADQNRLIVFGSAALQLTVTSKLLSADIDLSLDLLTVGPQGMTAPKAEGRLRRVVAKVNAALSKDLPYIQVCHWMTFQPANRWERRVFETMEGAWRLVYPHPYDILFSKLRRTEPKDIEAFRLVIERTGHPTEEEFIQLCIENYRDFEPRLKTTPGHLPSVIPSSDLRSNTVRLWKAVWNRSIKIDREIREPAVQRLEGDWDDYDPSLKRELGRCAQTPRNEGTPGRKRQDRSGPDPKR